MPEIRFREIAHGGSFEIELMKINERDNHTTTIRVVSGLFFLSGMTGLSYEVIWFKQFSHVWGSSTLAMASVVGAFLAGLGIGARVGETIATRTRRPVAWYGIFELSIGLMALAVPHGTSILWQLTVSHDSTLREYPVYYSFVRCALTFVLIGPPCAMMGATLPLLVRYLSAFGDETRVTSHLYGLNTLGAALGCYLVGFQFLPGIGLSLTNTLTALANVMIGLPAILFSLRFPCDRKHAESLQSCDGEPVSVPYDSTQVPSAVTILGISALTGAAAIILQTVWNRQLALVLGSSTYAFSAMLLVILMGIGVGSLVFKYWLLPYAADGRIALYVLACSAVSTVIGIGLLPFAADFIGVSIPLRANFTTNTLICLLASAMVEFLPATFMGMFFPILVHFAKRRASLPGTSVGSIYAANTFGTLLGAIATATWIIPAYGTRPAIIVATSLYLLVWQLIVGYTRPNLKCFASFAVAFASVGYLWIMPNDPRRLNMGKFLYGYNTSNTAKVLFFKEGAASNVLVTEEGGIRAFRVNGKVDGSTGSDMSMQAGAAYLPRLLRPEASNVLVIGFGTGTTSGCSLLFPDTHVTCCEIEPAIVAAAPIFSEVNHDPLDSPNFKVVFDDARAYVQGISGSFDLILSEPSNPWIAGVANLFTSEFYRIASDKLAPRGVFAQWIQTYNFTPEDYAMILQTIRDVFPHQRLIRISAGDTILLAGHEAFDLDPRTIQLSQELVDQSPAITADLTRYFSTSEVAGVLLGRILLDEEGLQTLIQRSSKGRRNRDQDLQLEFRAARHLYEAQDSDAVERSILNAASPDWLVAQFSRLSHERGHMQALNAVATIFLTAQDHGVSQKLLEHGLAIYPDSAELIASRLIISEQLNPELLGRLLNSPDPSMPFQGNRLGVELWKKGNFPDAVKVFEGLCSKSPESATCWMNLAINLKASGRTKEARVAMRRAVSLDGANTFIFKESERIIADSAIVDGK